jgi:hypothetical protein
MVFDTARVKPFFDKIDGCLLMAKAATSNKARAQLYAAAEGYLKLAQAAELTRRVSSLVDAIEGNLPRHISSFQPAQSPLISEKRTAARSDCPPEADPRQCGVQTA